MVLFYFGHLVFFLAAGRFIKAQDPCTTGNHRELEHLSKRSPTFDMDSTPICDRNMKEDWYKAKYYKMSTAPPTLGKCGTLYPVWLAIDGLLPSDGNTKTLTACEVGFSDTCKRPFDIDVKNCTSFLVYKLKPLDVCNSAYCFEITDDCVNESIQDVEVTYHNIIWNKTNDGVGVTKYDPYVNLKCSFTPVADDILLYYIDWYVDNETVIQGQIVNSSSLDDAVLSAADMNRAGKKINSWIHCVVGLILSATQFPCVVRSSELFFAGIEVLNHTLTVERKGQSQLMLRQTIPFASETIQFQGTKYPASSLHIKLSFSGNNLCPVSTAKACEIEIQSFNYDDRQKYEDRTNWEKIHTIEVFNSDEEGYYMPDHKLVLRLESSPTNGQGAQIFSEVLFHDVHINIIDDNDVWKGKSCRSRADPHQTTFDGYPYECQENGCITGKTYIFYRNDDHLQEIQVRHGSCGGYGRPRCVCAVAARAGQDVFTIDVCSGSKFINFPLCNDNSLKVIKEYDMIYKIIFPTGTFVRVNLYNYWKSFWFINLAVYPTISDVDRTSGLCGVLDGNKTNDLRRRDGTEDDINIFDYYNRHPDQFSLSWQLPDSSSEDLFSTSVTLSQTLTPLSAYFHKLCKCVNSEKLDCSYKQYTNCRTDARGREYHCVLHGSSRRKRDLAFLTQHQGQLEMKTDEHLFHRVKRQTLNEVDAYNICYNAFQQSTYYESCLQIVPNFSNEGLVDCMNDLVMTGEQNLTQVHLDAALGQCQSYILLNSTLVDENPDITTIIVNLCPNNCSNRGECSLGLCSCEYGFGGSDCSFDVLSPPTVTRLSGDGVCDKSSDTCDDITLYGQYFLENMNTNCFMTRNEMDENNNVVAQKSYTVPLIERTLFEGYCGLEYGVSASYYTTFNFYLSNDGTQSLTPYTVYTYQSTCQNFLNVSGNIAITLQSGYCFINGACVQNGMFKSNETCWQCVPSLSTNDWSWECNKTEITITPTSSTSSVSPVSESASSNPTTFSPPLSSSLLTTVESATSLGSTPSLQSTSTVSSTTGQPRATTGVPSTTLSTSPESSVQSTSSVLPTSSTKFSTSSQSPSTTSSTPTASSTTPQSTSSVLTSSQPITPLPPTLTTMKSTQAVTSSPSSSQSKSLSVEEKGLIGAVAGVAVVILVVVGYMVKQKCSTKKADDNSTTLNHFTEDDVNIYPSNKPVASMDNFNTADLFQFDSPTDKYSRPPSATSMRDMPVTNDLRNIFDQQHPDKLFSAK